MKNIFNDKWKNTPRRFIGIFELEILHARGKAMECIGKYIRQIFQTRALNIERNVFN
jgi:hypothetical protein